jgi:beta-galactosidase/beta-glucuronidase
MPHIPDRNMGIWQDVLIEWTGPVDIRNPFISTDLPLPDTNRAMLSLSAELVNAGKSKISGILKGHITGTQTTFEQTVQLEPGENKPVVINSIPPMEKPRLWWPVNYGRQNLYDMNLEFEILNSGKEQEKRPVLSDRENVTFGVREITKELHWFNNTPGLRIIINGKKIFSQGGWLQPELMFDMPSERMDAEVRYLTESNLNTVTVEDLPVLNDDFIEACDRRGLMLWMSFYSSTWLGPERNMPLDKELLARGGADVIKRYRNHPSLILYSCVGEGIPSEKIYNTWRNDVLNLDGTRLFVPTIDVRQTFSWIEKDLPTGLHDAGTFWDVSPVGYFQRIQAGGKWMFNTETSIASIPPVSSLIKFIPDLLEKNSSSKEVNPLDATWAHHDFSKYFRDFDPAIRIYYGNPADVVDYCWRAQLLSAERHRAWSEAVNHRMWNITSGVWQWKLNSCWPAVGWQIYDWYLKPMVSSYYYRSAFENLHIQMSPLDGMISIINRTLNPVRDLEAIVKVYDSNMQLRWQDSLISNVGANTYRESFTIPPIRGLSPVFFTKLQL